MHTYTFCLPEEQYREELQTSVQVVSPPKALDQSPISPKFGCNIVLIQLGLELSVVNKHQLKWLVIKVFVYIMSYLLECPGIQFRLGIN